MIRFLVPCDCGQKLEVAAAQAGQRLPCVCGREIDVPTFRGLQLLERVGDDAAPAPRRWGARQGLLFLGASIAIVCTIAAMVLEINRPKGLIVVERYFPTIGRHDPAVRNSIEPMANFDSLSPADVWLTWQITAPVGADRSASLDGTIANRSGGPWRLNWSDWRYLDWAIGGIGIALIAAGLLVPAKKVRQRARNRAGAPS